MREPVKRIVWALSLGLAGFAVGMALHVVLLPSAMAGVKEDFTTVLASNLLGALPFVAVGLALTVTAWTKWGAAFQPVWVFPVALCAPAYILFASIALAHPGPKGSGFELGVVLPLTMVRPGLAALLGGALMQCVNVRRT